MVARPLSVRSWNGGESWGYTSNGVLCEVLIEQCALGCLSAIPAMGLVTVLLTLPTLAIAHSSDIVSPPIVLGVVGGTVTLCLLIGLATAWGTARVRPVEVLRYE